MKKILIMVILIMSMIFIIGCSNQRQQEDVPNENKVEIDEQQEDETPSNSSEEAKDTSDEKEEVREGVFPGDKAYDFALTDRDGNEVKLSDYKGKVVFVNFWASWCPPCKAEMPYIQNLYNKYKDSNEVAILTINLTKAEKNGVADTNSFMDENKYNFPVLLDKEGKTSVQYRVTNIPTTYIINKEGIISNYVIGPMNEERMEEHIQEAME